MLTTDVVAEIKAATGYKASDVARAYGVHRSTVKRIWDGTRRTDVLAAPECPSVISRDNPVELYEDVNILLRRGHTVSEVAKQLGITKTAVQQMGGVFV